MDIIRVLRLTEISGPRDLVEKQLEQSIHGKKEVCKEGRIVIIRSFTLGEVNEIIGQEETKQENDKGGGMEFDYSPKSEM